jgi:hypothetical protein
MRIDSHSSSEEITDQPRFIAISNRFFHYQGVKVTSHFRVI